MEQLLNQGSSISELGFLRVLQLVHEQTAALVESLKMHELPTIIPRSPQDSTEFRRSLVATTSSSGSSAAISVMLETAMEELFAPYTEGSRYIDKECKCLTDLYAGLLSVFAKYHVRISVLYLDVSHTSTGSSSSRNAHRLGPYVEPTWLIYRHSCSLWANCSGIDALRWNRCCSAQ